MKTDIYQITTNRIIQQIENGTRPWTYPWAKTGVSLGRPLRANGLPYAGINILILWSATMERGFISPYWLTFKQVQDLGGQVRKGERSERIVFTSKFQPACEGAEEAERKTHSFLKAYAVFNATQVDNLPDRYLGSAAVPVGDGQDGQRPSQILARKTGAIVKEGGDRAFYSPKHDNIGMPALTRFADPLDYDATLLHELIHWTGHASRLAREIGRQRFGDAGYAMEELVAELGAAFLCADLGLAPSGHPREDHAAYLAAWLAVLKSDKRAIFTAASHAGKAADYVLGAQVPAAVMAG